jgi:hypothetical protein
LPTKSLLLIPCPTSLRLLDFFGQRSAQGT